jgi:hypothetical protein
MIFIVPFNAQFLAQKLNGINPYSFFFKINTQHTHNG